MSKSLPTGPGPALSIDRGRGRQAKFKVQFIRIVIESLVIKSFNYPMTE
jgi:hypothetical protein